MGYVVTTRAHIESRIGKPTFTDEGKVTTEWVIIFGASLQTYFTATIYDWKRYEEGAPAMDETIVWHVGGHDPKALAAVGVALSLPTHTDHPLV